MKWKLPKWLRKVFTATVEVSIDQLQEFTTEQAVASPYTKASTLAEAINAMLEAIPAEAWTSLRQPNSKEAIQQALAIHKNGIALATYDVGVQAIEQGLTHHEQFDFLDLALFDYFRKVIDILSNDATNNRDELNIMLHEEKAKIYELLFNQILAIAERSGIITDEQQETILQAKALITLLMNQADKEA